MKPSPEDRGPFLSSTSIFALCKQYDATAKPALGALAMISAVLSGAGLLSQFQTPDLYDFILCALMGFSLYQIARVMWRGAWYLPNYETKQTLRIYSLVATLGFSAYAGVSVTANLSATAGEVSRNLAELGSTDGLENAGQEFASHVDMLNILSAALAERAAQAAGLEQAEINGQGPTGVPGRGSVSNSFGASAAKYRQAGKTLDDLLARANGHVNSMTEALTALRAAQTDNSLSEAEQDARLKVLSSKVIAEMRALMALDPARAVRAAASAIASGVPTQSRANAQSQARIAEISAGMRTYARELEAEADRIAALSPELPTQSTLSTAERLLQTAWRLPALTMAALLLDLCGWIAVGYRVAIYQAYKTKRREETERVVPNYVTLEDFGRVEEFFRRMAESKARIEDGSSAKKRGRPIGSKNKPKPKPALPAKKKPDPKDPKGGSNA